MRLSSTLLIAIVLLFGARANSQTILAENFRNTDCANCRQPDDIFEQFLKDNPKYKVVVVNVHNANPSKADPFYIASKTDVEARSTTFYNIISNPTLCVNGFNAGSSSDSWKNYVKSADMVPLPATLTVTKSIDANKLITVKIHVESSNVGNQVRPYVYLLESGIKYWNNKSYGNFPDSSWNNILRAVAPSGAGGNTFTLIGSKDIEITYDASQKTWDMSKVSAVVFLQGVDPQPAGSYNYPIYALIETPKGFTANGGLCGSKCSEGNALSPVYNINDNSASLNITLAKSASVKITLSDLLGMEAATVYDGFAKSNTFTAEIPTNILPAGIYFARMFVGGTLVDVKKILVRK